ncbi:hypothetical protein C7999DRAFT_29429 [Corynascus novoguineensis]|uniref:Uncharacterized protein n=1 Tax=Corynascus novoguineensis TaxID=1126955 RepID=A0AAN7HSJ5_9PEZI|nr:hypothetical protein C7999DRAFT_29429 [Corynascus novoguineensis]
MKFTIATVLALAATAFAYPAVDKNAPAKRQNIAGNIDPSVSSMTDASGNVVPFDATKVFKDATAKGI